MALVEQIARIDELLLRLPSLVDACTSTAASPVAKTAAWLRDAEQALARLRLGNAGNLSALRATLENRAGRRPGESAGQRRSQSLDALVEALVEAEAVLRKHRLDAEEKLDSHEGKLVEALTVLVLTGHLPERPADKPSDWPARVWQALATQPPTRPTAVWLATSLGTLDRLFLLDRLLVRLASSGIQLQPDPPPAGAGE